MSKNSPVSGEKGMKLRGRLKMHTVPKPGFTEDDLLIGSFERLKKKRLEIQKEKNIERKLWLLNSDPKFKMIFAAIAKLPHVNIPMKKFSARKKLTQKWIASGKAEDAPDETDFYTYIDENEKKRHLEWAYNEYMAQNKEENESSGSKSPVAQRASSKRTKKKTGKKKKKPKKNKKTKGGRKTKKKKSFFSGFHMS